MGSGVSAPEHKAAYHSLTKETRDALEELPDAAKSELIAKLPAADATPSAAAAAPSAAAAVPASATSPPTIFLDIDGVCHPLKPSGHCLRASMDDLAARADAEIDLPEDATASTVPGEFEAENMRPLASCVKRSGARLILSSTWRETAPQRRAVDAQLVAAGMPMISGCTGIGGSNRTEQILQFVHEHKLGKWVAVDDAELKLPSDHYVHIEPGDGFTDKDAERVCNLLL